MRVKLITFGLVIPLCTLFLLIGLIGCQDLSKKDQIDKSVKNTERLKFPESIYPAPAKIFKEPMVGSSGCPNLKDVSVVKTVSKEELFDVISRFGQTKEDDLALSDRTFWPVVEENWKVKKQTQSMYKKIAKNQIVLMPASKSPYADLIRNNCDPETLEVSLCVAVLPEGASKITDAPSLTSYYYFIKRLDKWLIWFSPH